MELTLPADIALTIADRLWVQLGCSPLGRPARRYVTFGDAVADECDAVVVAFRGMTPVALGRGDLNRSGAQIRCNESQWLARYEARLLRSCWPGTTGTGRPPAESDVEQAAVQLTIDGVLLAGWLDLMLTDPAETFAALAGPGWSADELSGQIGELVELGPLGGQAGWAIQFGVLIPQECLYECLLPIPDPPSYLDCDPEPAVADCDPLDDGPVTAPLVPVAPILVPRAPVPPWRN